ncbi:MAG: MBL fold metallo-hydrolase [Candidatus Njordarchaeum guaymaensis]
MVIPGIYRVDGVRGGNVYILSSKEGLTIIDTGLPGNDSRIISYLEDVLGSDPEDVIYIILTHGHLDHSGSLPELADITGAKVVVHEKEVEYIRSKVFFGGDFNPDILLVGGEQLDIFGQFKVIHAPGHTDGSIVLWKPGDILITGDVLITNKEGRLELPKKEYTKDEEKEKIAVKELTKLDFSIILPGHGPPILEKARDLLLSLAASL